MHIKDCKLRSVKSLPDLSHEWSPLLVDSIDSNNLFHYAVTNLRSIARLIWPVWVHNFALLSRKSVQRREIQRCSIENNKVSRSTIIHSLQLVEHTGRVANNTRSWDLRVGQQSFVAEVVCANPHGVDGLVLGRIQELLSVRLSVLGVRNISRDFVFFHRRRIELRRSGTWRDLVAAFYSIDGIVVQVRSSVLLDVRHLPTTTI